MSILQAIILGIVQGITEFLPISSSAHLRIVPMLFNWDIQSISFDLVLHAGSLLAVLIGLNKDIFSILKNDLIKFKNKSHINSYVIPKLLVATLPAVIIGILIKDQIEELTNNNLSMALGLILVGIIFLFVDKIPQKSKTNSIDKISFKEALIVGISQPLAFLRGVSRSGITILAGVFSGINKEIAVKFSFILSAIILCGTSLLTFYDIVQGSVIEPISILIFGFFSSFIASFIAIKTLLKILKTNVFIYFGIYRIFIGLLILFSNIP